MYETWSEDKTTTVFIRSHDHYLLNGRLCLEEDASAQQLCEDAANWPDVDAGAVVLGAHQDLGRAVVLRHHFLRHVPRRVRLLDPRQTKVTDLWTDREKKLFNLWWLSNIQVRLGTLQRFHGIADGGLSARIFSSEIIMNHTSVRVKNVELSINCCYIQIGLFYINY